MMNELLIIISIISIFILIIHIKNNRIRRLENEKDHLVNAVNLSSRIIRESNVLGIPPKRLPKEFD